MSLSSVALSEIEQAAARDGYPADTESQRDWLLLRSPWTRHELLATHDGMSFLRGARGPRHELLATHDGMSFLVPALPPAVAEEAAWERPALPGAPRHRSRLRGGNLRRSARPCPAPLPAGALASARAPLEAF